MALKKFLRECPYPNFLPRHASHIFLRSVLHFGSSLYIGRMSIHFSFGIARSKIDSQPLIEQQILLIFLHNFLFEFVKDE